ncbi:MAG: hypothetical protein M1360_00195 [Candidatus Marsarchaeota archaeon]|jgi:hypothetical protein|nr:hypothetical protein [Candidatus Marsarchaeota archaeon]MCL5418349.1 hypothetical protein [Candidatus Marsarchaeota archaeon]
MAISAKKNSKAKAGAKGSRRSAKGKIEVLYVRLNSIVDLARYMAASGTLKHVSAIKDGSAYKVFGTGEKISGMQVVYYANANKISKFIVYNPSAASEYIEMRDTIAASLSDYSIMKAPVLELETGFFVEAKAKDIELTIVKAGDFESFAKALVNDSQYGGSSAKAYAFFYKGEHYLGSFELMRDNGKIFTYVKLGSGNIFNYLKYNYSTDSIEPTNSVTDKAYTYVRVINLAEPFPFFNI